MIEAAFALDLCESYGTPLFAYDAGALEARYDELSGALPRGSEILYSLKANPLPALVSVLASRGAGAEVSSSGELAAAMAGGVPPHRILYGGPAKTVPELAAALHAGVQRFSVESPLDYQRLADTARIVSNPVDVLFRINQPAPARAGLPMSGATQFGFDLDTLGRLLAQPTEAGHPLRHTGLHFYAGTQMRDAGAVAEACAALLPAADRYREALGWDASILDFGGGFPWPFAQAGDSADFADELRGELAHVFESRALAAAVWFEAGRYLCAPSGTLIATVLDRKRTGGRDFVVLDAGINHLGGMSGLGRLHRPAAELLPLEPRAGPNREVDVVGPLCTSLDSLARNAALPPLRPGDRVAIPNVGAYGATASLPAFLSRPAAAEVVFRGATVLGAYRLRTGHEPIPAAPAGVARRAPRRELAYPEAPC